MKYPKGKLILEEKKMNVTLTLNEITVEQAERVLDLVKGNKENVKSENSATVEETKTYEDIVPAKEEKTYTVEEVRKAFADMAKEKGKDKAKELLQQFGASKVTELRKDYYSAIMELIKGSDA